MLSIQIDTKSLLHHQFNNIKLSFFASHVVVGAPGRPTGFTPYPAKDSLFGLFLEQAESWYTGYRAISS